MPSCRIGRLAREFLSRAPRPKFRHVAPGISAFSAESLSEIYSSESSDSFQSTFNIGDPDEEDW